MKQNRPRSSTHDDNDRTKDALQKLKKAYNKIVKENKQLRKQLNNLAPNGFEEEPDYELEITPKENSKSVDKLKCGKCKSENVIAVEAGIYLIHKCEDCGHKKSKRLEP